MIIILINLNKHNLAIIIIIIIIIIIAVIIIITVIIIIIKIKEEDASTPPPKEPIGKKIAICPELDLFRRYIGEYIFRFSACPVGLFVKNNFFGVFWYGAYWDKRSYRPDVTLKGLK